MEGIHKTALVVSKILEILHWIAAVLVAALAVCTLAARDWLTVILEQSVSAHGITLSIYNFEAVAADSNGAVDMAVVFCFSLGAVVILALMAMVFRNVYLIIRKSRDTSPFQKENIRRLRQIGIFTIAAPVIGLVMSILIRLISDVELIEATVGVDGFVMGILVLCLTQYFAYGAELEADVDGLV